MVAIAADRSHSLALKSDGTVVGWGYDFYAEATVPVGLREVIAIAAGADHSLALKSDGTVVAWGDNGMGQTSVPVGLRGVAAIAAGGYHNLALVRDVVPPVLRVPAGLAVTATGSNGAVVTYGVHVSDAVDPHPTVRCRPASGSLFPLAATKVYCRASDTSGNIARARFRIVVTYAWSGFLPPIHPDGTSVVKVGRTVPLTFALVRASAEVTDAQARLLYATSSNHPCWHLVPTPFRYDADTGTYVALWRTKGLQPGPYLVKIDLADGNRHIVQISLRP